MKNLREKFNLSSGAKRGIAIAAVFGAAVLGGIAVYQGCESSNTSTDSYQRQMHTQQCTVIALQVGRIILDVGMMILMNSDNDNSPSGNSSSTPSPAPRKAPEAKPERNTQQVPTVPRYERKAQEPVVVPAPRPQPAPVEAPKPDYKRKYIDLDNQISRPAGRSSSPAPAPANDNVRQMPSPQQDYKQKYQQIPAPAYAQ